MAPFGDNVNVASLRSFCVQKHTRVTQKHIRTTIVIHSTVRFNVSHPVSTVGSCPNKGALHSSLCCSHPSLTPRFFLPSQTLQNPVRERRRRYRLWPNQDILTTNRQSASLMDNAQKLRIWNTCVKLRMHKWNFDFAQQWQIFAEITKRNQATKSGSELQINVMKLPIAAVKFYIRDQDFNLAMEHWHRTSDKSTYQSGLFFVALWKCQHFFESIDEGRVFAVSCASVQQTNRPTQPLQLCQSYH